MVAESPRERVVRSARGRLVAQAYRLYATLLVEHERTRRARWSGGREAPWEPATPAWRTLRFLAAVHEPERRAARVVSEFLERHGTGGPSVPRVTSEAWMEALEAGIELVADVLVGLGAELPWGRGKPRAPRRREDFEAVCRFLRDRDVQDGDLASLAGILDAAQLPPLPPRRRRPDHRVTFYRGSHALSIDGVRVPLPMGRELLLLEVLAERRRRGEVTPRWEHEIDWKRGVDRLRTRIRKATGHNLLRAVILPALPPVGGYRLAPGVRVRRD